MAMIRQPENFPETVKEVRRQLALSQHACPLRWRQVCADRSASHSSWILLAARSRSMASAVTD